MAGVRGDAGAVRLRRTATCDPVVHGAVRLRQSTIANEVDRRLHLLGRHTFILDGDNIRHGLNKDLGFTEADRVENIRRVASVALLMAEAGLIVLVSLISASNGKWRAKSPGDVSFMEVFVDAPLAVCEGRDTRGLYARARSGLIANFPGVSAPYEAPEQPDLRLDTAARELESCVASVLALLEASRPEQTDR